MNRVKAVFGAIFCLIFFVFSGPALEAQSAFARGEELFMQNRPQEALRFLEAAVNEDPAHVQAFLYLGIVFLQLNRVDDAIATYRRILPRGGSETARIAYNLGNAYFVNGNFESARRYFTLSIENNPAYAPAFLNRANALVRMGDFSAALADYETYISLERNSRQREQITRLMAFIREEFAAGEQRRLMAEEAARVEAERRRQLLEQISESLHAIAAESTSLSAGFEDIQEYESEFELE